jgi:ribosomal protein S2
MSAIDKMKTDGTWETLNKRERLFKTRQREKLEKNFVFTGYLNYDSRQIINNLELNNPNAKEFKVTVATLMRMAF